ncbi:uncharacterized protein LOC115293949 [Suricata suricatta]|uniref:uncharacterized protein LOC115293949 n=1 Tax=Suricata suricatta TaxID=37032 RepID=UPI00115566A6|nr:uncharacterized protein LOC115293949 [Suricata suricatta]
MGAPTHRVPPSAPQGARPPWTLRPPGSASPSSAWVALSPGGTSAGLCSPRPCEAGSAGREAEAGPRPGERGAPDGPCEQLWSQSHQPAPAPGRAAVGPGLGRSGGGGWRLPAGPERGSGPLGRLTAPRLHLCSPPQRCLRLSCPHVSTSPPFPEISALSSGLFLSGNVILPPLLGELLAPTGLPPSALPLSRGNKGFLGANRCPPEIHSRRDSLPELSLLK